jgi:hypothetical protein
MAIAARSKHAEWLTIGAILIVSSAAIASVAMPVASIGFIWEREYHEGWNAYYAARAAAGEMLYAGDPARLVSYPFLSFYLVSWLTPLFGNVLIIGRSINVISLVSVAICSAFIVGRLGGRRPEMLFAAAAVLGLIHIQAAGWIAQDEPQMLAEGFAFGGLLCYLSGRPTLLRLVACALLCCASGFTKPITAAIPVAITVDLLWRDRRACVIWCLCGIGALSLFAGLSYAVAGGDFISEMFAHRLYYWSGRTGVWYHLKQFGRGLKIPLAVCLIYLCQRMPAGHAVLLRAGFVGALGVGIAVSGGEGVSYNAYLELAVLMGIIMALALGNWRDRLNFSRASQFASALLPLVIALPIVTKSPKDLGSLWDWGHTWQVYMQRHVEFLRATEFLAQEPGDALCDSLLLCLQAGKPLIVEPFSTHTMILAKQLDETKIVELVEQHRFAVIELPYVVFPYPNQPDRIAAGLKVNPRFTDATLRSIDRFYAPVQRIGTIVFYLPRNGDRGL